MPLTRSAGTRAWIVLVLLLAGALLVLPPAGSASADVSSLDAYAGEAAVLGKPHHRHRGPRASTGSSDRLSASSRSNGSTSTGGVASGANGSATGIGKVGSLTGTTTSSSSATGGKHTEGATPGPTAFGPRASSSTTSSSLIGTDVIVLIALVALLIATGVLIRRLSRGSNPPGGPAGPASPPPAASPGS
jgi:cobalamin biosynthesis Mg chelatase CobN